MTQKLIARIEAATGPDREIDRTIFHDLLGFCRHDKKTRSGAQSDTGFDCDDCSADSWGNLGKLGQRLHDSAPSYTVSVDAALTLVPENHTVDLTIGSHWPNRARLLPLYQDGERWLHRGSGPHFCSNAATTALALCAAALKARLA
jgi:hypothetical protein